MTDTEILDYLQESYMLHRNPPHDCLVGRVFFTTGLKPGTVRELLVAGIERDRNRRAKEVADKLRS